MDLENKLRRVENYLSPTRDGEVSVRLFKEEHNKIKKAEIEDWNHKRKVFLLHKREYKHEYKQKFILEKKFRSLRLEKVKGKVCLSFRLVFLLYYQDDVKEISREI